MDFQSIVDGIQTMACVVSVEKKADDTYGDVRIVTGNKAYISSIENPAPGTEMLRDKFTPNSLYTDYLTQDLNFEDYSYRSAVLKKCLHSYAHPDRMDVWFNMMFIPLWPDNGDICYCMYLMEISFEPDTSAMSAMSSNVATAALDICIKLSGTKDFKATMKDVIKDIRDLCDAEHCCILTIDEMERSCAVLAEAFAEGSNLLPMEKYLDNDFYDIADSWEGTIAGSNCIIAKNEHDMKIIKERNPVWYSSLTSAGAHSIVLFPLKSRGERMGYMWALNFDKERATRIKETLEVTTFILGAELGNYLLMDKLRNLGSRDMLTGVMNRNEMNNYVDALSSGKYPMTSVGVIFADINGLKEVNDVEGHNAGDTLIKNCADILREEFDERQIFRAGGDEFAIIVTAVTEEELKRKTEEILASCEKRGDVSVAIGGSVESDSRNVRMALRLADERMYENKKEYYSQFADSGRSRGKDRSPKESELVRRMNYDQLTGLPSMTFFFKLAENARKKMHEEGVGSAVLFMNLRGMGDYNKKYGYAEGDKLLREVAVVLTEAFGEENSSRFEQDHFAAIAQTDGLDEKLNGIFKKLRDLNDKKSLPMRVGIYPDSIGMVETSRACDRAKYAAKSVKNEDHSAYIYYDEKMLKRELNSKYVIENLDRALNENWITAYYQPIIRSTSRKVCDEEALARWIDPEKGMLSPADFIPVLEDTKLIYKVDLHMVDVIIEHYKKKKRDKMSIIPVSVNLSRADFDMCDIVEEICNRVDTANMPRELLTIEITESLIGENFAYIKEQVKKFQDLGFKVWMDDFGSGYSSLNLLQDMQFDVIKFDMQFMRQFDSNPKSRLMLAELMRMAVRLGIETVTEGVETQEQVDFLCEVGCTRMQGYYFCKPVPMEEVIRRHKENALSIGYEKADEITYHSVLSSINLYDLASKSDEENRSSRLSIDAQPVLILESDGDMLNVVRSNKAYKKVAGMYSLFGADRNSIQAAELSGELNNALYRALLQCEKIGQKVFINELADNGDIIHAFAVKIADKEEHKISAYAFAIVGITPRIDKGLTFTGIAKALSVDYIDIYQVDLDTEHFIEYRPDSDNVDIVVEKEGDDFFATSRNDALSFIHEDDRDGFIRVFTKENVVSSIDEHGVFTYTYRADFYGDSIYVNMKALRLNGEANQIIIGVNNVDAQMRERETLERLKEEKATYSRISVLMGDFIAIYTVDPETGAYMEYSSSQEYSEQGLDKIGTDFFAEAIENGKGRIHPDDYDQLMKSLTMENVLAMTQDGKVFIQRYRLKFGEEYTWVCLRGGLVKEKDGAQLIMGISIA